MKQADRARYNTRTVPHQLAAGIGNGLFRMPLRDFGKLTQLGTSFVASCEARLSEVCDADRCRLFFCLLQAESSSSDHRLSATLLIG
jgi:hypothetical protein